MDESIFAEELINAATLSGCWEECDSNAGKLQQVACACYPFRRLQLQAMGVSGANQRRARGDGIQLRVF
eukprot:365569-Chlamydomonas_euryale.AAC.21